MLATKPVTIVETKNFEARAKSLLSENQRIGLTTEIAENPGCGSLMPGTGGCRKVRFALTGRGKSGSIRAVYLYCGEDTPTFLLALFAKNEKSNLTKAERNQLAKNAKLLCKTYGTKQ